ncbi:MAG: hypothetical protein LJE92_06720 [Gammaproteobacteria bacterium]|jgi:hypothetical protein|nr:hypothetical protein [Gammaproteobacteria bacterium]
MTPLLVIIILAILAVVIVFRLSTRPGKRIKPKRAQSTTSSSRQGDRSSTQWRAVKIAPGLFSCDAAGKLAGKVFLSRESPQLPLDGCLEKDCRCKYVHLEDRRDGGDRRYELGDFGTFFPVSQVERRRTTGRRSEDLAA